MRTSALVPLVLVIGCAGKVVPGEPVDSGVLDASDAADTLPPPDYARCTEPGSCIVVPRSCCGSCGAAITADMIGVESSQAGPYRSSVCKDTGCPACYRQQDPFLQAFCEASHCTAIDLHGDPMTACTTDSDCQLRYAACCEPCDAPMSGLLALNPGQISSYRAKACAPDATCPKCMVRYPDAAKAMCDATKHCAVTGIGSL